jgi:hypothetical protein
MTSLRGVQHAAVWLGNRAYVYTPCTDPNFFIPNNADLLEYRVLSQPGAPNP